MSVHVTKYRSSVDQCTTRLLQFFLLTAAPPHAISTIASRRAAVCCSPYTACGSYGISIGSALGQPQARPPWWSGEGAVQPTAPALRLQSSRGYRLVEGRPQSERAACPGLPGFRGTLKRLRLSHWLSPRTPAYLYRRPAVRLTREQRVWVATRSPICV